MESSSVDGLICRWILAMSSSLRLVFAISLLEKGKMWLAVATKSDLSIQARSASECIFKGVVIHSLALRACSGATSTFVFTVV